jgi:predicted AlkP superfamily phosphohydrolase/phosphomutase
MMSDDGVCSPRVLVVGYDGASWDLVEQWTRAGKLPVLASLIQTGSAGPLRSVIPVLSPAAWATFATGVFPGKHGIFDFEQRAKDSYRLRLVTARDVAAPAFWDIASRAAKRTAVLNVPLTYPPSPVNGVMVSGLGTPDSATFTFPAELSERLTAQGYRVNKTVFFAPGREDAYLRDIYDMTDRQATAALSILKEEPWDLFVVVFRDLDEVSHYFWKHMDASHPAHDPARDDAYAGVILEYYQHLDQKLGEFMEASGPGVNTLVLSDHGFGPLYKDVYLNEWLKQQGFLATAAQPQPLARRLLVQTGLTRNRVSRSLQALGLARLERGIRRKFRGKLDLLPAHNRATFPEAVDWEKTRCYSYGYHGQVFVNLAGREPQGTVTAGADYEAALVALEEKLRALVDPEDGQPVITRLIRGRALFGDAVEAGAPDLVLMMRDLSYITRQGYEFGHAGGQVFGVPASHETGSHREIGIAVLSGPGIKRGGWQEPVSIADLAPTLLQLLGIAAPGNMEGRVLSELLTGTSATRPPVVEAPAPAGTLAPESGEAVLSEEEEAELRNRLRKLGYLG